MAIPDSIKEEEWRNGALPREGDEEEGDFFSSLSAHYQEPEDYYHLGCDGSGEECPGCNRCTTPEVEEGAKMTKPTWGVNTSGIKGRYVRCPHFLNVDPVPRLVPTREDGCESGHLYEYINRGVDENNYAEVERGLEVLFWEKHPEAEAGVMKGLYEWMSHEYDVRFLCYLRGSIHNAESLLGVRATMKVG